MTRESHVDIAEREIGAHLDAGDVARATEALLAAYGGEVFGMLVARLRSEDEAFEVYQDFSTDVHRGMAAFRRASMARTWAYTLARHAACRFEKRQGAVRGRQRRLDTREQSALPARPDSRPAYARTSVQDRFAALRSSLDPDDQTLLTLRFDRDMSWRDVAEVLETNEQAVRARFARLKARLRTLAEDAGVLGG